MQSIIYKKSSLVQTTGAASRRNKRGEGFIDGYDLGL